MQRLKVCRKLMAFVLTLCMVLPLISNQYLVVRAEETGEGDDTISYTQVQKLTPGDNIITNDAPVVNYLNESGEAAQWTDQVFQYTVPDTGDYGICLAYSGDSQEYYQRLTYYTCDDQGRMIPHSNICTTSYYTPKEALADRLQNGKTYWFKLEYTISLGTGEKVTKKDQMQDVTLTIVENIPRLQDLKEKATIISGAYKDTFADKDRYYLSTEYMVYYGKLYSVTLEPATYIDVTADQGRVNVYEYDDRAKSYVYSYDFAELPSAPGGKVQNNGTTTKTYYIFAQCGALTVEFDDIQNVTPATPIADATIEEFKAGQEYKLSTLEKQKLQYNYLRYRGETKEDSTIDEQKEEGYWAKLIVPEGNVYQLETSSIYFILKHDSKWDVYEKLDGANGTYEVTEGTYYIHCKDVSNAKVKVTDLPDVSTIKANAVKVTEDDVKTGYISHDNSSVYYKYCAAVFDGKANYSASLGVLYKITVPAGKAYVVNGGTAYSAIVYDGDFKYIRNDGKMENGSDESKTYYVWKVCNRYDSNTEMKIQTIGSELKDAKTNAVTMRLETTETYQYNDSDESYIGVLSYNYGDSTLTIENAKVYAVDPGIYTLNVKSDNTSVNAKLYLFETDDLYVHTGDLVDYESGYSTKLNLSEERNIPVHLLKKGYIVISGDKNHLDAAINLTLKKAEDNRLSVKTNEIRKIENGDNECSSEHAEYTIVTKRDGYNTYMQSSGVWYKYHLDLYTEVEIKVPLSGEMYVYKNPDEPAIDYVEAYAGEYTYKYENKAMESCDLYICVQQNPSYEVKSNTIQVDAYSIAPDISLKQNQATEIQEGSFATSKEGVDWVLMPEDYDTNGTLSYSLLDGKLYKVNVEAKQNVDIQYDDNATLIVYDDLQEVPVIKSEREAVFNNLSKGAKVYYIWISGDNDNKTGKLKITPLQSQDTGSKKETTIPVSGSTTVTIEEEKNSSEATIKTSDTGISADTIKKSIEIANQYNSDNEADSAKTKVTSIQTTYTDDTQATISADVVKELQSMEKPVDLEVSKMDGDKVAYTWKMKADSIENIADMEVIDINTKVEVKDRAASDEDEQKIKELAGNEEVDKQVVEFAHEGKLPEKTEVTVAVESTLNGKTVYYFHFDKTAGVEKLVYTGKADVKNGYVTMVLDHCSDYVIFDKNVCTHSETKEEGGKEATCGADGYTGDVYCKICNELVKKGEVIPKTGKHTSSDWIVDKAATVEAEGSRIKKCTVCGEVVARESIAKLPTPEPTPAPVPTPEPTPTPAPTPTPVVTPNVTVSYRTHVQSIGWQNPVTNGTMSGTSGRAKRLEGIEISVAGNSNLGIQYTTHCQSYGWLPWSANGEMNGTEGEAKRLEAIKIQLTGADKDKYNVYYRVHAQSYGWLAWAANGAPAGTAGLAKRLEAIQIVIVKKGESFDHAIGNIQSARGEAYIASSTANANPVVAGENNVNVEYRTHVQSFGWQGWKYNGVMSGTSGKAKRLEGINIKLTNKPYSGSIVYTTHVQSIGWQGNENNVNTWFRDGQMAGTSGRAKRLEAIRIALTGEMAEHYDVYYRVHAQSFGWLDWTKNGEAAGTAGLAKRLEGIQIVLVPKGGAAPARNYGGVVTINNNSYIKR